MFREKPLTDFADGRGETGGGENARFPEGKKTGGKKGGAEAKFARTLEKKKFDLSFLTEGKTLLAGVDEVGRGPLAGPVVCAAVILPYGDEDLIVGVDDSKKVSEKNRVLLSGLIRERAIAYSVCEVSPGRIDEVNILNATIECMVRCIGELSVPPDFVLADAVRLPLPFPTEGVVRGDAQSYAVGAASIVAKVYRDGLMERYAALYPGYGFERIKGYGTKEHIEAIREVGPCPIHRKTFIGNFWDEKGKNSSANI